MNCGLFSLTTPRKPSQGQIVPRKLTPRGFHFATLGQFAPRSGRGEILALSHLPASVPGNQINLEVGS